MFLLLVDVPNVRPRMLESVDLEKDFDPLPAGETGDHSLTSIPFQLVPSALYFPNFATIEQYQRIIEIAKANLEPSSLALRKSETEETIKGIRTSCGTFISASEDKTGILDLIEEKIAKATMIPKTHGEAFNVLLYEIGQRYQSHYDVASFLLYLSDVEESGETVFPFENGQNMDGKYDFRKCIGLKVKPLRGIGLKVKPLRGDGLLFHSLLSSVTIDLTSLHGSCPVIRGEKRVATKWIRNIEQNE
ncbi:unnamed protein product [Withania somnifera]